MKIGELPLFGWLVRKPKGPTIELSTTNGLRRRESTSLPPSMVAGGREMKDKGNVCYAIFFMLGVGSLLPWNVFINAFAYFQARFTGTAFQNNFENFFGICFNVSNVISLTLVTKYNHLFSMHARIVYSLLLQGLLFTITTILVLVPPDSIDGHTLFAITIPTCLIAGLLTAILQGGVFGLAGMFPGAYMQALMAGQGLGGMGVSIAALVTTAAAPPTVGDATYSDVRLSTFVYFLCASIFSFVCVMAYFSLKKLPFALHHAGNHKQVNALPVILDTQLNFSYVTIPTCVHVYACQGSLLRPDKEYKPVTDDDDGAMVIKVVRWLE
jgi:hypothetical protein